MEAIERLRNVVDDGRGWLHSGVVTAVSDHTAWGLLLDVTVQPDGREVQCRPSFMGTRARGGGLVPVEVGDEVLVVCPDGDINSAIAIVGLTGGAATLPNDWENDRFQFTHPTATKFETVDGAVVVPVVTEPVLPDLSTALTEITTLLAGLGLAAPTTTGTFIPKLASQYRSKAVETE